MCVHTDLVLTAHVYIYIYLDMRNNHTIIIVISIFLKTNIDIHRTYDLHVSLFMDMYIMCEEHIASDPDP